MILNESQKAAEKTVIQFFDLLCKRDVKMNEFESLIQSSYRLQQEAITGRIDKSAVWDDKEKKFVSNKDRSKIINLRGWQDAIQNLLNKMPKSYRILKATQYGANMVRFDVEVSTRFLKLIYSSPNVIRENDVWQINPVSTYSRKKRKRK